jgi:hypothetical protein
LDPQLPDIKDITRSNPDLDGNLWKSVATGFAYVTLYNSAHPKNLGDVSLWRLFEKNSRDDGSALEIDRVYENDALSPRYEHPYEKMAYEISEKITNVK